MKPYKIYTVDTAKPPADKLLLAVEDMLGFVPNVFAVMAESEPSLRAFIQLNTQMSVSGFDATERELIQTVVSVENQCSYCVAGHTTFAYLQDVDADIIEAARNRQPVKAPKLEALQQFTLALTRSKGTVDDEQIKQFFDAGYTPAQALEVILGICVKTFSNLTNSLIGIPLDDEFAANAWDPKILTRQHQAA